MGWALSLVFFAFMFSLPLLTLTAPERASALESASCPAGTTLRWAQAGGGWLPWFNWQCVNESSGSAVTATWADVDSCPAGQKEQDAGNGSGIQGGTICVPDNTPTDTYSKITCAGTWDKLSSPVTCFWRGSLSFIGSGLVWLVSWVVVVAGMLFNWAIKVTVLDFTGLFYTAAVNQAVADVWTNIRDLANILIIGLFVFIAISIILGLQEFGQKKLIARVIIVAILINFSFLFTQIAINTSNFFASQIIAGKAQQLPITNTAASVAFSGSAPSSSGLAGEFLKFAGAETFGDTWNALSKVAENNQSAWVALLHGIVVATLLLVAAATLFYGAFLLLARGVVLLFLLMTSAFAFATYLSPTMADSDYGFKGWKNQLLRNMILAPAMMIFLWATLKISAQLAAKNGTLGSLIADPKAEAGIGALFSYFLIIGMLFGALKLSSSLAGATGRLALNSTGIAGGLSSMAGAFVGRNSIGRFAAKREHDQYAAAKDYTKKALSAEDPRERARYEALAQRATRSGALAGSMAKKTFDFRNTGAGALLGKTGVPKTLSEGTKQNYADIAHKAAEDAAKQAGKVALKGDDIKEIAKERAKQTMGDVEGSHDAAAQQVKTVREEMRQIREQGERTASEHDRTVRETREHQQNLEREQAATTDAAHRDDLQRQIRSAGERIDAARRSAESARNTASAEVARMMPDLRIKESQAKDAKSRLTDFNAEVKTRASEVQGENLKIVAKTARDSVGNIYQRSLYKATGIGDGFIRHEAEVAATSRAKIKDKAEARAAIDKYNKANDHAPAPAAGSAGATPH